MNRIIISTESGSDLPYKITVPYNIEVVPLHVTFGNKTFCDGSFDFNEIYRYYDRHKSLPKTSAVSPGEYIRHFSAIFSKYPDCRIIHISYSSKLSVTYRNAIMASGSFDGDKIRVIDSMNASAGAGVLVMLAARITEKYYDKISFDECVSLIKQLRKRICCSFVPDRLDYMRAGGRISGVAHLGASVLNIKPSIVIENGYLSAGKKYRGAINRIAQIYMEDFTRHNNLDRDFIVIGYTHGVSKSLLFELKRKAHKLGFSKSWCFQLGSAVTCHTGPVCIGYAGAKGRGRQ